MSEPYHRYVFDSERRRFVGEFEEMYAAEEREGFDSWHQDEPDTEARRRSLELLEPHIAEGRILDFGCGKGTFASMLARPGNSVTGVDVSETAIRIARERHPGIDFRAGAGLGELGDGFRLACAMEVLSYLEDWREVLARLAGISELVYVTLYLPPDPIGFVKSLDELREALSEAGTIETDVVLGGSQLLALCRTGG